MAGEKSVLSGEAGQKITKRLLEFCGWQIAEHIDFKCQSGRKHKSTSSKKERNQHSLDGMQFYQSPLNHSIKKLICISAKHHIDEYPNTPQSKLNKTAKELAQSIECAKDSSEIAENFIIDEQGERSLEFDGLITFFSSSLEEKHTSFFKESGQSLSIPSDEFDTIYFIDNKRATFLYSSISEAVMYSDDKTISFIYPDTGSNNENETIKLAGRLLPLELMCSDVLPILVQKADNYHILIFCNDNIERKYLKRIIWLVHRLCGFASRTFIYFPNYDSSKHDKIVSTVKQEFQESNYIEKITVKKWDDYSFIKLKENNNTYEDVARVPGTFPKNDIIDSVGKISEDYDKMLPFGNLIKPILSSSLLSATDLKNFLKRKGIFVKYANKELIVPIFANLLLSPVELDFLKGMLVDKEEKPKSLNISAHFNRNGEQLKQVIQSIEPEKLKLRSNCKHIKQPRLIHRGDNRYELEIEIERNNTTKDLISGKTHHSGMLTVLLEKGRVNVKIEFTSNETKQYLEEVATAVNVKLKEAKLIKDDMRSIKFRDFKTNQDRVEFLTGFKDLDYSGNFFRGEIVNIKFKPDETIKKLPDDLKSYKGKVKNLDINGNLLEELPHIEQSNYKDAILLSRVKIQYYFSIDGNEGVCIAEIGFPSTLNGKNVDMDTNLIVAIEIIKSRENNISDNIPRLQNRLSRALDQIVLSKYMNASYTTIIAEVE